MAMKVFCIPREYLFAMFPNIISNKTLHKQRGFLLPLALFILVVMGVLALTISRTSIQTQTSGIQEMMNVQAFYAAESGAQRGMQQLFSPGSIPTRDDVDSKCNGWSQTYSFTANGLKACTAEVDCVLTKDANDIRSFYTIASIGRCGKDNFRAERTIEVGAHMMEEE
jgi:MSHA biogenesis protein MshP